MQYKTVTETARIWNVSERLVRRLLAQERIPGAVRMANGWLIPENAQKPSDARKQRENILLPLMPADPASDEKSRMVREVSRAMERLQMASARRTAEKPFEQTDGPWKEARFMEAGRLSVYDGDYARWELILQTVRKFPGKNAELVYVYLRTLLGLPFQVPDFLENMCFEEIHPNTVPFAWIVFIMHLFVNGNEERMTGAAAACCRLLTSCSAQEWIYIRILAAAGYQKTGNIEASGRCFREAVERAVQEDIWSPFVELQNFLPGMLSKLEKAAGEARFRLKAEWIAYSAGWTRIRGYELRNHVDPELLTPRELDVALLAAAGDTNPVIAHKLGISTATVKKNLEVVFQKLDVHSRKGLKYILPAIGQKDP